MADSDQTSATADESVAASRRYGVGTGLDGPQRHTEAGGDLRLGQLLEVGQADDLRPAGGSASMARRTAHTSAASAIEGGWTEGRSTGATSSRLRAS